MFLGIDTSLGTAVAAVSADGYVQAETASTDPLGHAEVIGELLLQTLALAEPQETITHVAVGMGPGPFTGLRVGIAAAKTFALARGIPVVPVVSHDAVALAALIDAAVTGQELPLFAVVTDARRQEFAYTVYGGLDEAGLPERRSEPTLVPRNDLEQAMGQVKANRYEAQRVSAAMIALAATRAVAANRQIASGQPLYLRSPDVTLPAGRKRVTQP